VRSSPGRDSNLQPPDHKPALYHTAISAPLVVDRIDDDDDDVLRCVDIFLLLKEILASY